MTDNHSSETREKHNRFLTIVEDLTVSIDKPGKGFKLWVGFLLSILAISVGMYVWQLIEGLGVTNMRDIASWGLYISNFVFLIAVSLVGSLIAAILKLTGAKWSIPLTRISEIIAIAALLLALFIIIVDMGRPDRLLNIFAHGRLQSPIVWDIIVVNTYLVISLLLLYLPLIPDIAILRKYKTNVPKWKTNVYKYLSLGWEGTDDQYATLKKSINMLVILIIPVAFAIHTVTSWLFASTLRPGWDSTIFGPYFVAGAFMVGSGVVTLTMYIFQKVYKLNDYITDNHFDLMGKLMVLTSLIYLYFNINEYIVPAYKMKSGDAHHIHDLFLGEFAIMFWFVQIGGMIMPIFLLLFKNLRKPKPVMIISIFVIVGAFFKRYLIITPTLLHPFLPVQNYPEYFKHYSPSLIEWSITLGTFAAIMLIITFFVRLFPIVPIWETANDKGIDKNIINM